MKNIFLIYKRKVDELMKTKRGPYDHLSTLANSQIRREFPYLHII